MSFGFDEAFEYIEALIKSSLSLDDSMTRLLGYCDVNLPNPVWAKLRDLDFEADILNLKSWLENILLIDPPAQAINAFWFGIHNPILNNSETSCGLYLSGSAKYDPNAATLDWAVWDDQSYLPRDRYANSEDLSKIFWLVKESGVADIGEYISCLGYASLAVKTICSSIDSRLLFGERESRVSVVGFDSGDFIVLDPIVIKNREYVEERVYEISHT